MGSNDAAPRVHGASSSRKLLHMLLCFTEQRPTWTVAELAAELQLSVTSAYRYLALLREVGLLDSAGDKAYRVTDLSHGLARACDAAQVPLADVALPVMTRMREQIDETVLVARRGGNSAYCVDRVESRRPVRLQFDPGQAMDLHAGSLSRILLAAMPATERRRYVESVLASLPAERAASLAPGALDATHARGWTESFEEVDEGIWGCAAAIHLGDQVVGALGTAAPVYRTDEARRAEIIDLVRRGAEEISAGLG
ncbi:IclR family transcriptional regulator [Nocardioides jishulii]|uniref:IclR family transcriptional regulator n=1 Tax=Nocardioides jishulii TaxID=2575440 RepID=A0A4U2YJ08_9ACTN|nr:IclR family transcriptional regulator [Nocardioides jishulii]QCX28000.1 IclR family transcriptional regulator [Nocardioides jishulii]TKI60664.1 IclR family transcriptional regulator [Nocardioides jishulii]